MPFFGPIVNKYVIVLLKKKKKKKSKLSEYKINM